MEAKNIYSRKSDLEGWHKNTELCVNLKTILSGDRRVKTGKVYRGMLRRDSDAIIEEFLCRDAHYTFIETLPLADGKRNPHLFRGEFITITRAADGSLRLNFKHLKTGAGFSVDGFAIGVMGELREALTGLVESE